MDRANTTSLRKAAKALGLSARNLGRKALQDILLDSGLDWESALSYASAKPAAKNVATKFEIPEEVSEGLGAHAAAPAGEAEVLAVAHFAGA